MKENIMRTKDIWVTLVCLLTLAVPALLRAQAPTSAYGMVYYGSGRCR